MESSPSLPDIGKYRDKLRSIARFVFAMSIFAFVGAFGMGVLLAIVGSIAGHDEPSTPDQHSRADLLFETLGIALLSPIFAGIALFFVNDRTYRGIYLTLAGVAVLFPFPIYLIFGDLAEFGILLVILPMIMGCLLVYTLARVEIASKSSISNSS